MGDFKLIRFQIVGIFPSEEYQKCKYYADYLHKHLPQFFAAPKYRPMLDVQWTEFLTKCRRNFGVQFWKLESPVVVFRNGEYFGNDYEFTKYCNICYRFHAFENFDLMGKNQLFRFIKNSERIHVFFLISIDDVVIGSLLFQLFTDLVPLACSNFMRLVNERRRGYLKAPIHRIVKSAWIQIGGTNLKHHKIPCENYYVPHDTRGVISMCHAGKHKDNNTQFFISLQKSHWMDCYYVAFGQLIHGEEILQKIEAVPTKYETPLLPIVIEDCGEYNFTKKPVKGYARDYEHYIGIDEAEKLHVKNYPDDISDFRDVDSFYSVTRFEQGLYSLELPPESDDGDNKTK